VCTDTPVTETRRFATRIGVPVDALEAAGRLAFLDPLPSLIGRDGREGDADEGGSNPPSTTGTTGDSASTPPPQTVARTIVSARERLRHATSHNSTSLSGGASASGSGGGGGGGGGTTHVIFESLSTLAVTYGDYPDWPLFLPAVLSRAEPDETTAGCIHVDADQREPWAVSLRDAARGVVQVRPLASGPSREATGHVTFAPGATKGAGRGDPVGTQPTRWLVRLGQTHVSYYATTA
jgi:hypothetical protein